MDHEIRNYSILETFAINIEFECVLVIQISGKTFPSLISSEELLLLTISPQASLRDPDVIFPLLSKTNLKWQLIYQIPKTANEKTAQGTDRWGALSAATSPSCCELWLFCLPAPYKLQSACIAFQSGPRQCLCEEGWKIWVVVKKSKPIAHPCRWVRLLSKWKTEKTAFAYPWGWRRALCLCCIYSLPSKGTQELINPLQSYRVHRKTAGSESWKMHLLNCMASAFPKEGLQYIH